MLPSWLPKNPNGYSLLEKVRAEGPEELWMPLWAAAGRADLYFLASKILTTQNAPYMQKKSQWLFDRFREVQANPDNCLDAWAREHYKSEIHKCLAIQDMLKDPNQSFCFFSFKNAIAKGMMRNVMYEMENNELLKSLYPEILWENPRKQAPKWSENEGVLVKRTVNTREATFEASGLVDGQPTSKHYGVRIYDDVVVPESVSTDEQMAKTSEAYRLSNNLGKEGGVERVIGTRYHRYDLYNEIMEAGVITPRIYPCYELLSTDEDGEHTWGDPVLYTAEYLAEKRKTQGPYTFSAQMLCDPIAESVAGFRVSWLRYYSRDPWAERGGKNVYILVDPANSKKDDADYTAMVVVGLGSDHNYYVLDIVRERLNLTERVNKLFELVQKWNPVPGGVIYERYGMQGDIDHIKYVQEFHKGYRFEITEAAGKQRKEDRIRRLVPPMEQGRFYFPHDIRGVDDNGNRVNLMRTLLDHELEPFPLGKHDDILDALSRIFDAGAVWPTARQQAAAAYEKYDDDTGLVKDWMSL